MSVKDIILSRRTGSCDRRTFLRACGVLGVGAVGGGVLQAVFNVVRINPNRFKVSQTRTAMGTYVTMTVLHESRDLAQEAIGRAFEEVDRLVAIFSRHDPATPVSAFNRDGALPDPPAELAELVRRALYYHRLSYGAFDITVKPLLDLFQHIKEQDTSVMPAGDEIRSALELVGVGGVCIASQGGLRFRKPGMGITLDGIAKGYIVDKASDVLVARSVSHHLINAGGDIRTRGTRSNSHPWTIAIEDPEKRGRYPDVIHLTSGAVATSGSYEIYYDKDRVFHHLIDPKTGRCPRYSVSASVMADTATQADALSTSVFVLHHADAIRLIDALPGVECLILDERGQPFRSRGWHTRRLSPLTRASSHSAVFHDKKP